MALREVTKEILVAIGRWRQAITNPEQFLQPAFQPTEDQLMEGIEFYLTMFVVSFLFYAPLALTYKGETADKTKIAVNGALGLLFTGLVSMTWYGAFWLLGGTASFPGTLVGYIYAASPYLPLTAFCGLVVFGGLPEHLRRYALNPATSQKALQVAMQDPDTSKGMVGLGSFCSLGIMVWTVIVVFRCFSYIHELTGWKLAGAIAVSLVFAAPVSAVLKQVAAIFQGGTRMREDFR